MEKEMVEWMARKKAVKLADLKVVLLVAMMAAYWAAMLGERWVGQKAVT